MLREAVEKELEWLNCPARIEAPHREPETYRSLARKAGIAPSTVSRYFDGADLSSKRYDALLQILDLVVTDKGSIESFTSIGAAIKSRGLEYRKLAEYALLSHASAHRFVADKMDLGCANCEKILKKLKFIVVPKKQHNHLIA